jgi:hypothetical protein
MPSLDVVTITRRNKVVRSLTLSPPALKLSEVDVAERECCEGQETRDSSNTTICTVVQQV